MDGRKYGVSRRPGFLLAEALAVLFLVSLTAAIAFPALWDYEEKRELDLAAETLASAIREVQVLSKNDTGRYGNTTNVYHFYCLPDGEGRAYYYTRRGVSEIRPKGRLPSSVRLAGKLELTFRKNYAWEGNTYSTVLTTRDGKYRKEITVAVYTGRVRVN